MVIVAAVDRSDRSGTVFAEAVDLAEAFEEPVHVVHVMSVSGYIDHQGLGGESREQIDTRSIKEIATEIADRAIHDCDVSVKAVGLEGKAAAQIVKYAEEHDARYVVMSARKRSPAGKAIFGSVTQSVLLNASCPVVSTITQAGEDS